MPSGGLRRHETDVGAAHSRLRAVRQGGGHPASRAACSLASRRSEDALSNLEAALLAEGGLVQDGRIADRLVLEGPTNAVEPLALGLSGAE
jgi:hypothetical protein